MGFLFWPTLSILIAASAPCTTSFCNSLADSSLAVNHYLFCTPSMGVFSVPMETWNTFIIIIIIIFCILYVANVCSHICPGQLVMNPSALYLSIFIGIRYS